jgi:hypothetical protein
MGTKDCFVLSAVACLALSMLSGKALSNAIVDLHDPLRGITFYSIQLSTDDLRDLEVGPGRFSDKDLMTMGVSALIFDENSQPNEYILWLRHDGPARWLVDVRMSPIRLVGDTETLAPLPLHILRQEQGKDSGPFVEKLEFALRPEEFDMLLQSESVVVQLSTLLGAIEKTLSDEELAAIRTFKADAIGRHKQSRSGLASLR